MSERKEPLFRPDPGLLDPYTLAMIERWARDTGAYPVLNALERFNKFVNEGDDDAVLQMD